MQGISRALGLFVGIVLASLAGYFGYRVVRSDMAASVYRQRLAAVAKDYESLRETYNEAVRRTAVTELVVRKGALSVRVRTDEGVVREIPAPYDPAGEIYVDYVVKDDRLWIRRVFDSKTPPAQALVVDPGLKDVDWNAPGAARGTCVYRSLADGRWVVSVSGDGALTLARAGEADPPLVNAPEIRAYAEAEKLAAKEAESIGLRDVWNWITGPRR